MHPFIVLVAAVAALFASTAVGMRTGNPKLRAAMQGTTVVSLLVIVGCIALGLWQAWAPWEVELVEK
jgi:hypothetical protein